ncbi:phosphatidate cytidylyltransferase [Alphaproteobacteria bacterium endosymbiont of Tiliacea citrago]|uniref:phosphatidate cytidylyltransferase n=1 Tax=Alphaproteobacteria bacterium endosymbiont of Tiliacea citrago TaxID=3077944 RepID=UPI00313AC616
MLKVSKNFLERFLSSVFIMIFIIIFNKKMQFLMLFLSFLMLFEVFFAIKLAKISRLKKVVFITISVFIILTFAFFVSKGFFLLRFILSTFVVDTSSYIGGNLIKSKKIFKISPNKTIAGYIFGIICGSIAYYNLIEVNCFISIMLTFSAILGDLLVSYLKRELSIKDFSKIIPGHGGLFDRFDSLCLSYIFYNILL